MTTKRCWLYRCTACGCFSPWRHPFFTSNDLRKPPGLMPCWMEYMARTLPHGPTCSEKHQMQKLQHLQHLCTSRIGLPGPSRPPNETLHPAPGAGGDLSDLTRRDRGKDHTIELGSTTETMMIRNSKKFQVASWCEGWQPSPR